MVDPALELHAAFIAALKGAAAVEALVSARVFDSVGPNTTKPYITLGQPQVLPDKADCIDGAEVNYTVHGWAQGPQSVEIKKLGKAIAGALDDNESMSLTGHRVVLCELSDTAYLDDPDGLTKHVAVTFRVLTEPV